MNMSSDLYTSDLYISLSVKNNNSATNTHMGYLINLSNESIS